MIYIVYNYTMPFVVKMKMKTQRQIDEFHHYEEVIGEQK